MKLSHTFKFRDISYACEGALCKIIDSLPKIDSQICILIVTYVMNSSNETESSSKGIEAYK